MTRVFLRLVLVGVMGIAGASARVSAQPAPQPTADKKQAAKKYTEAGLTAARLGDYDAAIDLYQRAFSLVPHPTLTFDMAEAHFLAGRIDQALTLYKRYLSDAPRGPLARDARDRIAEIEAGKAEAARKAEEERRAAERRAEDERRAAEARKAEEARTAEEARKAEAARKADEARRAEAARGARERTAAAGPPGGAPGATPRQDTGSPQTAPRPGRNQRIAGIAVGAGGVVGVGIGIGFGLHARTLSSDLSKDGAVYDPSKIDAGHRANTIAIVGMAGGTALVAAGAALYWWGYTQGRSTEQVSLAPVVSDGLAGLVITGTWR